MTDEERQKIIAYQACFGTPHGNRVLEDLERNCFVNTTAFTTDPYLTAYRNGFRDIYTYIMRQVNKDLNAPEKPKTVKQNDDKII